jgi:uncharacterized delta-60 repeat protein
MGLLGSAIVRRSLLASLVAARVVQAAPGDLDPTFDGDGIAIHASPAGNDSGAAVLVQPDGKILVVGQGNDGSATHVLIARFTASGAPDIGFGSLGAASISVPGSFGDLARAGALQPDGKIIAAGISTSKLLVLRTAPNGATLDSSFGSGGVTTLAVGSSATGANDVVVQPNGKIVAVGFTNDISGDFDTVLVRYNDDGTLDSTFGDLGVVRLALDADLNDEWESVALLPDGRIIVAGYVGTPTGSSAVVARFSSAGVLDGGFGIGGIATVSSGVAIDVALDAADRILVAGSDGTGTLLARLNASGTLDPTFGFGGIGTVAGGWTSFGLAVAPDGRIVVAGATAPNLGSSYDPFVARFNTNGNIDMTFGCHGTSFPLLSTGADQASDVALQPDGRIVVAGTVDSNGTVFPGDFDLVALRFEGTPAACGNGVVEPGEACDDGGTLAGDGCDGACQIETGFACGLAPSVCTAGCGDGTVGGFETCDDGNLVAGDGCDGACRIEDGWSCTGSPSTCLAVCGDSRIVGAEECDDGNGSSGDCCSASCQSEPTGGPCTADTSQCSFDLCSAHGYCTHEFVPDPSCGQPAESGRATLKILDLPGAAHDRVELKIAKGPAVTKAAFGIPPLGAPTYALCVYEEQGSVSSIVVDVTPTADADCSDGTCWQEKPYGWKLKSTTGAPDGVVAVKLREGIAGKSKLIVQAKGQNLATPALPLLGDTVTAEIRTSDGQCFGGIFTGVTSNSSTLFRAKSQ